MLERALGVPRTTLRISRDRRVLDARRLSSADDSVARRSHS
jgi:hypothetical protein